MEDGSLCSSRSTSVPSSSPKQGDSPSSRGSPLVPADGVSCQSPALGEWAGGRAPPGAAHGVPAKAKSELTIAFHPENSCLEELRHAAEPESAPLLHGVVGGNMGFASAVFNLTNSIIGAGVVALPSVLRAGGYVPFLVCMAVAFAGNKMTLDMLCVGGWQTDERTFVGVGKAVGGTTGPYISLAVSGGFGFIVLIAFMTIIAGTAPAVQHFTHIETAPWKLQLAASAFVIYPLCCLREQNMLVFPSSLAIVIFFLVFGTISVNFFVDDWYTKEGSFVQYHGTRYTPCPAGTIEAFGTGAAMVENIPTLLFAFVCHDSVFPIFQELKDQRLDHQTRVNTTALGVSVLLYVGCAAFGAFGYGQNTLGVILMNIRHCLCTEWSGDPCSSTCRKAEACKDDSTWGSVLNLLFSFAIILGYPTTQHALRATQISIIWGTDTPFSWARHIGVATFNVLLTLGIGLYVGSEVGVVLKWGGSLFAPSIAFTVPAYFFLRLLQMPRGRGVKYPSQTAGMAALATGVSVTVLSVVLNVRGAV